MITKLLISWWTVNTSIWNHNYKNTTLLLCYITTRTITAIRVEMILSNNHSESSGPSSHNNNNSITNDSSQDQSIKILKSYYNRDAAASVTKSFFTIEKDYYVNNTNSSSNRQPVNGSLTFTRTNSSHNHFNNSNKTSTIVKQKSAE